MWRSCSQLLLLVVQLTTALAAVESDEFNNEDPDIVYVTDLPEVVSVTDDSPIVETIFDTVYYTVTSDSVVEVTEEVTETITEEVVSTSLSLSVSTSASTHTDTLVLTDLESTTIVSWVTNTVVADGITSLVSSASSFVSFLPDEYVTVVETVVEVDSSYPTYTFTEEATFEDVSTITHTYISTFTTPIVEVINSTTTYLSTIGSVEEVSTITSADVVTINTDELEAIEAVEEIAVSNTASTAVYFTTISSKNDTETSTDTSSETSIETSSSTLTGNIDDIETSTTATDTDDAGLNCTSGNPCYTRVYSTMSCGSSRCTGAPGQGCPCKSGSMCTMRPGQGCPCKSDSMCTMRPGHNGSGMGSCQGASNCTAMRPSTTMDTMNFCQRPISTTYVTNGMTYTTITCDTVWETAMNHPSAAAAAMAPYYNATSCDSWCNMTSECSTNPAACITNGAVSIVPVQSERAAMAAASVTAAMERTTNAVNAFHGAANTLEFSFGSIVIFALSCILL